MREIIKLHVTPCFKKLFDRIGRRCSSAMRIPHHFNSTQVAQNVTVKAPPLIAAFESKKVPFEEDLSTAIHRSNLVFHRVQSKLPSFQWLVSSKILALWLLVR